MLVPLLFAILLSVLSMPLFSWLLNHRVPKLIAVLATVLANFAVVAALLLPVGESIDAFAEELPKYQARFEEMTESAAVWLESQGIDTSELTWLGVDVLAPADEGEALDETPEVVAETVSEALGEEPSEEEAANFDIAPLIDLLTGTVKGIARVLSKALLVFLIMIFILFEAAGLPKKLERVLGWQGEDHARVFKAKKEIQHYLGIKTLISLVTGMLVGLWLWLLGVDFALLWGLLAFLLNYIPSIGSILASFPAVLLALIDGGVGRALLVGAGYIVVNLVLGNIIEPHLMGQRLGISPLVVFLSLVFWGWLWGPAGMLLAVPLTMILKISLENTTDFRWIGQLLSARPPIAPGAR